jgi:hypothetical protein
LNRLIEHTCTCQSFDFQTAQGCQQKPIVDIPRLAKVSLCLVSSFWPGVFLDQQLEASGRDPALSERFAGAGFSCYGELELAKGLLALLKAIGRQIQSGETFEGTQSEQRQLFRYNG